MWHVREKKKAHRIWLWKPEGKNKLEDQGLDGRMILELILKNRMQVRVLN